MKPIQFRGKETMSYNKSPSERTIKGRTKEQIINILRKYYDDRMLIDGTPIIKLAASDVAAMVDKRVEERLREELIKYEVWVMEVSETTASSWIDEYLKNREK